LKVEIINEDYHLVTKAIESLKYEVENIDDELLIEEVMYTSGPEPQSIDPIIAKFMRDGEVSEEDRANLEWFYIISHV